MRPREGDRLVDTRDTIEEAEEARTEYAAILVEQGLGAEFGVFVAQVPARRAEERAIGLYVGPPLPLSGRCPKCEYRMDALGHLTQCRDAAA